MTVRANSPGIIREFPGYRTDPNLMDKTNLNLRLCSEINKLSES